MIDARELRIGNYVTHNHPIGMKLQAIITNGCDIDLYEELEPIPLTEEWLLKFGFEQIGSTIYINIGSIEIGTISNGKRFYIQIRSENVTLPIKSVHELQNLFFCLCGKELVLQE